MKINKGIQEKIEDYRKKFEEHIVKHIKQNYNDKHFEYFKKLKAFDYQEKKNCWKKTPTMRQLYQVFLDNYDSLTSKRAPSYTNANIKWNTIVDRSVLCSLQNVTDRVYKNFLNAYFQLSFGIFAGAFWISNTKMNLRTSFYTPLGREKYLIFDVKPIEIKEENNKGSVILIQYIRFRHVAPTKEKISSACGFHYSDKNVYWASNDFVDYIIKDEEMYEKIKEGNSVDSFVRRTKGTVILKYYSK